MPQVLLIVLLIVLMLLITGCSADNPQAMLEDYLGRVSRSLDQDIERADSHAPHLELLPRRRERRMAVIEFRTGLLETLDFSVCGLLPLIAERNSALGKVMKPSQLMRYELRFFDRLHACYQRDQKQPLEDESFSDLLAETYYTKRKNLQAVVWNGIFTSEAMERNLSLSAPPVSLEGNPGYGDSLRALKALSGYIDSLGQFQSSNQFKLPADLDRVEKHYAALHNSQYGSQLFTSLSLLTRYLNLTATTLEQAMARRPICFGQKPNKKARIIKNVFTLYYAGKVQPYMAMLYQQGQPWLGSVSALVDFGGQQRSTSLDGYQQRMLITDAKGGLWDRYQQAIKAHTQAWQSLLRQCGLMPGDLPTATGTY